MEFPEYWRSLIDYFKRNNRTSVPKMKRPLYYVLTSDLELQVANMYLITQYAFKSVVIVLSM